MKIEIIKISGILRKIACITLILVGSSYYAFSYLLSSAYALLVCGVLLAVHSFSLMFCPPLVFFLPYNGKLHELLREKKEKGKKNLLIGSVFWVLYIATYMLCWPLFITIGIGTILGKIGLYLVWSLILLIVVLFLHIMVDLFGGLFFIAKSRGKLRIAGALFFVSGLLSPFVFLFYTTFESLAVLLAVHYYLRELEIEKI